MERFVKAFAPCGFRREAYYPCYGLAEATLLVSGGTKGHALVDVVEIDPPALYDDPGRANGLPKARKIVSCGNSKLDQKIIAVDLHALSECPPGTPGEIWIAGRNVAQGYWNDPAATETTFKAYLRSGDGPFLRTGDFGYLKEGELFIQGRIKDVIIVRGSNFYPEDIEQTVERSSAALKPRRGAAFAVESNDSEHLIIVHEVLRHFRNSEVDQIIGDIRQAVTENHRIPIHAIVLIRAGSMPLTSSGKIQRALCRARFLDHSLDVVGGSYLSHAMSRGVAKLNDQTVATAI
jgi:acyl-CoA synthetase (AMP-forming)/AMP-acid ligase II